MGLREFFTIKSKKQKEQEQLQYNQWAFPYGPEQAQVVGPLLFELLPEEKDVSVAIFLMGKEAWHEKAEAEPLQRMEAAFDAMRPHLPGKKKQRIWRYLAALEADAKAQAYDDYPDVQTLRCRAQELQSQYQ